MKSRHSKSRKRRPALSGGIIGGILALLICAACASNPTDRKDQPDSVSSAGSESQVSTASAGTAEPRQASGQISGQRLLEETGGAGSEQAGSGSGGAEAGEAETPSDSTPEGTEPLDIHFLDVGQGDSTLLLCGGEAMLIDAGGNDQGTKIQSYLLKQGVDELKYVVCTHPDEDHIGGMDVILYKFDCETIFMTEEERDTNTYRDVVDTMWQRGYERTLPVVGEQYTLGDAFFTILGPASLGSDSNDNSIALLLTHGENSFLFTGDAEEEEEAAIAGSGISLEADVYKVGHHGSRTSSSRELLEAAAPSYAVISCEEGNSYGHPHAETMNQLRALGVQVYRTDEQGSIVVSSDGKELTWNCSPSETWLAGEPTGGSRGSTGDTYASVSAEGAQEMDGVSEIGTVTASEGITASGNEGASENAAATEGTAVPGAADTGEGSEEAAYGGASQPEGDTAQIHDDRAEKHEKISLSRLCQREEDEGVQ